MDIFVNSLAKVLASEQNNVPYTDVSPQRSLRVLKDEKSLRVLHKLFKEHCNEDNFSKFPAFTQDIDALFVKYGAKPDEDTEGTTDNDIDEE